MLKQQPKFKMLLEATQALIEKPQTQKLVNHTKNAIAIALGLTAFGFYIKFIDDNYVPVKTDVSYAIGTIQKLDAIGIYVNAEYKFNDGQVRNIELQDICLKFHHSNIKIGDEDKITFLTEHSKNGNIVYKVDTTPLIKKYCK